MVVLQLIGRCLIWKAASCCDVAVIIVISTARMARRTQLG
jgi:hypothetical protein